MVILFSQPWYTLGWLSTVAVLLRYKVVGIPFLPWFFWTGSRLSIEAGTETCWAVLGPGLQLEPGREVSKVYSIRLD